MVAETPTLQRVTELVSQLELSPGGRVTFHNVTESECEAILTNLGEHRSTRLAYSNGTLEIRMPGFDHEKSNRLVTDIVKLILDIQGRPYEDAGSTTLGRLHGDRAEPDTGFYIQNHHRIFNHRRLQVDDPPADLVIETDVTSKTTMDAYRAIGVPEVWVYAQAQLKIYLLQNGDYVESETSPTFPTIPVKQLIPQVVEHAWQVGRFTAFRALREILDTLA